MNLRSKIPGNKKDDDLPRYEPNAEYKPKNRLHHKFYGKTAKSRMIRNALLSIVLFLGLLQFLTTNTTTSKAGHSIFNYYYHGNKYMHSTVEYYDLEQYGGAADGKSKNERLLMCIPLRNAAPVIPLMFSHLENLTYPHHLIDIAFMVSDTEDNTREELYSYLDRIQTEKLSGNAFNEIMIFEKDFGQAVGQGVDDRHGVHVQGARRKVMGRARNWLLSAALRPYHSWVYWRDADIETAPATIIEDLMKHGQDVIVPNVWRPLPEWLGGEQPYDLNSWQETEPALELAKTLDEDEVIVEGYAEYPTWRPHLAYLRVPDGNPDDLLELDGIGGVSILAKAKVFRHGANFPGFALWNHAETEAFGKMCRRMGFKVAGLIHYTIWHQYEPSEDDLKKIKEMEEVERLKKLAGGGKEQ